MHTRTVSTLRVMLLFAVAAALAASSAVRAQPVPPGLNEAFPARAVAPAFLAGETEAVVRLDSRRFEVESPSEAVLRVRRVVTVWGPGGRDYGRVVIPYDTFREIEELDGRLLDAAGEEIRDLGDEDIEDVSAISGYSLYEENRVRMAALYHDQYPYTVAFEYEVAYDGLIAWPIWRPQRSRAPVEHTLFEIDTPQALPARYTAQHTGSSVPTRPQTATRADGRRRYRWSAMNLPPRTSEPRSPSWRRRAPRVHTAPAVFEIEGRRGTMDSWKAFGQWYHDLNAGGGALSPEVVERIRTLVEGAPDRRAKVRRLYRYMQRHTRYVSVQLGIGGWKAFSPAYVHERGYGDCKALVHFMQALLREVGISSHPALLKLGREASDVLTALPSNQFNHVILAVPMPDGERLWLECTDPTAPFAHLSAEAEDRQALLVKDGASKLVRIPASMAAQNARHRRAQVALTAKGAIRADVTTRYTGNQQDRVRSRFRRRSARERRDQLRDQTGLSGSVEIVKANFSSIEARRDTVVLPMRLRVRQYASRTGPRLFFRPNLMARWSDVPAPVTDGPRTQPVAAFPYPFVATDTLAYVLPKGFAIEALPAPVEVKTPFAQYRATLEKGADGTLHYRRRVEVRTAELPAAQYDAFRAFMQRTVRADRAQVVLVKK